ncbi:MAG: hypothetical protein C5B56_02820 [Proteobacteria bacterium]|nr:MAG: hypothetical protein C5B56_02820 [Pseudomonadota bacterium]
MIQYAATSRFNHDRLRVLDRAIKLGDDSSECGEPTSKFSPGSTPPSPHRAGTGRAGAPSPSDRAGLPRDGPAG